MVGMGGAKCILVRLSAPLDNLLLVLSRDRIPRLLADTQNYILVYFSFILYGVYHVL